MGVFSDLLSTSESIDTAVPITALDNIVNRELDEWVARGDADYPAATLAKDEVQSLAVSTQTSGNMTLTFTLANGETFTTANIAYNAAAATIESAIDSAATTASVTGWTNGDITVGGGAVNVGAVTFTFDGASVAGAKHSLIVLADVDGAGGAWGAVSVTTDGQTKRPAWAALIVMSIAVEADVPVQGVTPAAFTAASTPGSNANYPAQATIRTLAEQAAINDGNAATLSVILTAARLPV